MAADFVVYLQLTNLVLFGQIREEECTNSVNDCIQPVYSVSDFALASVVTHLCVTCMMLACQLVYMSCQLYRLYYGHSLSVCYVQDTLPQHEC